VAIITGRCWTQLAATIPGFIPIADERVCLVGTRDVDSLEGVLLDESRVEVVEPKHLRSSLPRVLKAIREHVDTIYVHLDLDVLDSAVAPANSYALSGGLTLEDMEYALSEVARGFRIGAVTLSAYDPAVDTSGHAGQAAIQLISIAARVAQRA
jgi:arginase